LSPGGVKSNWNTTTILPYNHNLLSLAKQNRYNQTPSEGKLWNVLKSKHLGYKFSRQKPILNYIVDFYCKELGLVIELDGQYHDLTQPEDKLRQNQLEEFGLKVLRLQNQDIQANLYEYLQEQIKLRIKELALSLAPPQATPPSDKSEPSQGRDGMQGGIDAGSTNNPIQLLVSSLKLGQKREVLERIESGEAKLIVGTHALLQEKVHFKNLSLVIVDEQHRFGVNQRKELQKRVGEGRFPHLLTMTATPIPRSLALILYGELDQSVIKSKPPGRIEIQTELVPGASKQKVWDKMKEELSLGHAVIIVCPNITDTESSARVSAERVYVEISKKAWAKEYGVGLLHGKLKAEEKEQVMADFASAKLNVLVSTTVIEVGIDIPQATLMIIEGAEYFGLAQLHQLRGRVGRSDLPSFCYLVPANNQNIPKRLRYFAENSDGFKLAEYDLEQRGPGQIYGKLQSGALDLRLIDLHDLSLVKSAKQAAEEILNKKLTLSTELKANIQKHQDLEYLN
jgi:very-short-patch-repair endonuclease